MGVIRKFKSHGNPRESKGIKGNQKENGNPRESQGIKRKLKSNGNPRKSNGIKSMCESTESKSETFATNGKSNGIRKKLK